MIKISEVITINFPTNYIVYTTPKLLPIKRFIMVIQAKAQGELLPEQSDRPL